MEMYGTACKLMELHSSSLNCLQAVGATCKVMELRKGSWNCMQALQAHVTPWNLEEF